MAWSKNNIEVKIHRIRPKPDDNERFFEWTVLAQVVIENSEILRWRVENIIENIDKQDSTYLPDDCYVITNHKYWALAFWFFIWLTSWLIMSEAGIDSWNRNYNLNILTFTIWLILPTIFYLAAQNENSYVWRIWKSFWDSLLETWEKNKIWKYIIKYNQIIYNKLFGIK